MKCPECETSVTESKGSPVSPAINIYSCPACGWRRLRCGNSRCDGFLSSEETSVFGSYRYTCRLCDWTGVGTAFE